MTPVSDTRRGFLKLLGIGMASVATARTRGQLGDTASPKMIPEGSWIGQLYDHRDEGLGYRKRWGFAALIAFEGRRILFDTGGVPDDYAHNLRLFASRHALDLETPAPDALVLSHVHCDHTGGLAAALQRYPGLTVYGPDEKVLADAPLAGALKMRTVPKTVRIDEDVLLITNVNEENGISETSLVLEAKKGLVVITGCSHPGIATILRRAVAETGTEKVQLAMGGFHLRRSQGETDECLATLGKELVDLGVERVGLTHCTGDEAVRVLRKVVGEKRSFESRLDAVIPFS